MTEQRTHRLFRRFLLVREEDPSGVSGTGIVAEGCKFSTGDVTVVFTTVGVSGVSVFQSMPDMLHIHGHEGKTKVKWLDH